MRSEHPSGWDRLSAPSRPLVSVGLPVFNGDDFLGAAIDSILAQTLDDLELIICDNASTDRTEEIGRARAAADPRIRYHRQPTNLGACANYDLTFHLARGRYFKWAAHDDVLAPAFLERCVEVLERDPACVLVHPGTVIIDSEGDETACNVDLIELDSDDPVARLERWLRPTGGHCNPIFGVMRREVVATTGLHGDYPSSDRVFLAEMALRGRCRMVREGLFKRRVHPGNSVPSHRDTRDLIAWFTGRRPRGLRFREHRQLLELARALARAELTPRQRLRAHIVLARWARRRRYRFAREWMLPLYLNGQPTPLYQWLKSLWR